MGTKRRAPLSVEKRMAILKELESGLSKATIAAKYNVHAITVRRIRANAPAIRQFMEKGQQYNKWRRMKKTQHEELEKRLYAWYEEQIALGHPLRDVQIMKKARELNQELPTASTFKVSTGWYLKFKRRHNMFQRKYKKRISVEEAAARRFVQKFSQKVNEEGIAYENIYNMDESGVAWKALPTKRLGGGKKEGIEGAKMKKDRVTVGFCTNALGTHKLMPLLISKYKDPRALIDCKGPPIVFKTQKNACMDRSVFSDWYENHFKESVRAYQLQKNMCSKVILLLDNSEEHKPLPRNIEEDKQFEIIFLPSNCTSLIQPMEQGVIEKTKRTFRHRMMQRVLRYPGRVAQFYKEYSIKDCMDLLSEAWAQINASYIKNGWQGIFSNIPDNEAEIEDSRDPLELDFQEVMSAVTEERTTEEDVNNFLSVCAKEENRSSTQELNGQQEEEEEDTDDDADKEEQQEQQGETHEQWDKDGGGKKRIKDALQGLEEESARAPRHIQIMIQALKAYFLRAE